MFEYSLVAGLTASGADAYLLHVTTTPSVAYIARVDDFDCGIMISASHNPYYDNGIKLIDCYGEKMPEEILLLVEDYIDGKLHVFDKDWPELPFAHREHIGCTVDYVSGRNRYMGYLISLGIYSFKGVKVGLDCANGSSWNIAKSVFDALGADTYVINAQPNGLNINNNAGSTHIEGLQKFVVEKGLDIGFAYFLKKNFHFLLGLRLSVYIKRNRKAYYKLFEEADSEINRGDLTPFVHGFLKVLLGTIEDTIGVLKRKKDQLQRYEKKIDALGFHDKLMDEIYYILLQAAFFYGRGVTITELADMVGKARNTIQKRLDSMPVNHLIVEKKGKTNFYKLDLLMFKESGNRRSV